MNTIWSEYYKDTGRKGNVEVYLHLLIWTYLHSKTQYSSEVNWESYEEKPLENWKEIKTKRKFSWEVKWKWSKISLMIYKADKNQK